MYCLIDSAIQRLIKKGKNLSTIKEHIQLNHRIYIDSSALKDRIERIKAKMKPESLNVS